VKYYRKHHLVQRYHLIHLCFADQLSSNHGDRSAQGPAQLGPIDLLPNLDRALVVKLIASPQQDVHVRQIEAVLRSVRKLLHSQLIASPPLFPRGLSAADVLREVFEGGDCEGRRIIGGWEERFDAVVEVGE
jgi:hypothetical protein